MRRRPRTTPHQPAYPSMDRRSFLRRSGATLGIAVLWTAPMARKAIAALAYDVTAWIPGDESWRWTDLHDGWGIRYRLGLVGDDVDLLACFEYRSDDILRDMDDRLTVLGYDGLMAEDGVATAEAYAEDILLELCGDALGDDDTAGDDDDSAGSSTGDFAVVMEYEMYDPDDMIAGILPPPDRFQCHCSVPGR